MIELRHVCKSYAGVEVIADVCLDIAPGEFTVIVGGSGSGKSTLLRMMNRLVAPDSGSVLFGGADVRRCRPEDLRRRMGYSIQSIGLFPHWSVEKNIATVPALLKWPKSRIDKRVTEMMTLLRLDPALYRTRYPHQLSGGQQQRVGVARALAGDPEVLLMDEPFGALDPVTRAALQTEIARIHTVSGKTVVLVTHDIDEALKLATRMVLLDHGRVVQSGTPLRMLCEPASDFVLDFFGRADAGIRRLGLQRVADHLRPDVPGEEPAGEPILGTLSLREALSIFIVRGRTRLAVVDGEGRRLGDVHLRDLPSRREPATSQEHD